MSYYKLQAPYEPNGDQPEAIKKLVHGVNSGKEFQTLLGATGTGKTFTIANVIEQTGRPALVLAHNKTYKKLFENVCLNYYSTVNHKSYSLIIA